MHEPAKCDRVLVVVAVEKRNHSRKWSSAGRRRVLDGKVNDGGGGERDRGCCFFSRPKKEVCGARSVAPESERNAENVKHCLQYANHEA